MTQVVQCNVSRTTPPAPLPGTQSDAMRFIEAGVIPEGLECPITLAPMHDPVSLDGHGQVFERAALLRHFRSGPPYNNPASNELLVGTPRCTPRLDLRARYDQFRADVLALDPSKSCDLPSGARQPGGSLVTGGGDHYESIAGRTGGATTAFNVGQHRTGTVRVQRGHHVVERPLGPVEAGAVAGCALGTCCVATLGCLVLTPVVCALSIALCPINTALQCCGIPPIPTGGRCNAPPAVLE